MWAYMHVCVPCIYQVLWRPEGAGSFESQVPISYHVGATLGSLQEQQVLSSAGVLSFLSLNNIVFSFNLKNKNHKFKICDLYISKC